SPFRSFNRTANSCTGGSTILTAAPVENYNPRRGQIPIEPVAPRAPNFPRFRALALLGRLPLQRVDEPVIQASEKPAQEPTSAECQTSSNRPSFRQPRNECLRTRARYCGCRASRPTDSDRASPLALQLRQ